MEVSAVALACVKNVESYSIAGKYLRMLLLRHTVLLPLCHEGHVPPTCVLTWSKAGECMRVNVPDVTRPAGKLVSKYKLCF